MKRTAVGLLTACLAILGAARSAQADVAPPDDYVETCTVEEQQGAGETCVTCQVSYEDFEACATTYEPQGYTKRCKTAGASFYSEVYCRTGSESGSGGSTGSAGNAGTTGGSTTQGVAGEAGVQETPWTADDSDDSGSDGGCSLAHKPAGAAGLLLGLFAVGFGLRRRR